MSKPKLSPEERLARDLAILSAPKSKKTRGAKLRLSRLAVSDPSVFVQEKLDPQDFIIITQTHVLQYAILGTPRTVGSKDEKYADRQQRLTDGLYNFLMAITACLRACRIAARRNTPKQQIYFGYRDAYDLVWDRIREINRAAKARVDSPAIDRLKAAAAYLRAAMKPLAEEASDEYYTNIDVLKDYEQPLYEIIKAACQHYAKKGLHHSQYLPVVASFKQSIAKELSFRSSRAHFRYELSNGYYMTASSMETRPDYPALVANTAKTNADKYPESLDSVTKGKNVNPSSGRRLTCMTCTLAPGRKLDASPPTWTSCMSLRSRGTAVAAITASISASGRNMWSRYRTTAKAQTTRTTC